MARVTEELYTVKCDACNYQYDDRYSGIGFWQDHQEACESAKGNGWYINEYKGDYCPKCHITKDDELIIR